MTTTRHIEITNDDGRTRDVTLHTPRTLAEIHDLFRRAVLKNGGNPARVACWMADCEPIAHVHIGAEACALEAA